MRLGGTLERARPTPSLRPWLETGAISVVVAATAYVARSGVHSYPNFDEGNYLGSLDALRHGQALARDVFLDQPPGWYLLLVGLSYPFGNSVVGVRTGLLLVALLAVVAAFWCGRLVGGPLVGLVAAAVMSVARPFPQLAGLVESEPGSAALAVAAVGLGFYAYGRRFRPWAAFASGVAVAAAAAVKLPGATAALPIAVVALACRSGRRADRLLLPAAGIAAVVAAMVVGYHGVLPEIWHGVFVTHVNAAGVRTPVSNVHRALVFVDPRTAFGCLVIAGAVSSLYLVRRGRSRVALGALWLWAASGYAFVLAMHPLLDHHFVFLAVPLALPAGVGLGLLTVEASGSGRLAGSAALALVAALFIAGLVQSRREIVDGETPTPAPISWAVATVREHTTRAELVVSDIPIVPYLARRQMPGQLIDTSIARIVEEDLPPAGVLRLIDETHPAAVVVGRNFLTKPAIIDGLRRRYPLALRPPHDAESLTVYLGRRG